MALLNRSLGQRYDTPPSGDFARYVDQLLARQTVAGQGMVVTTAPGARHQPAATRSALAKPAAAVGADSTSQPAQVLAPSSKATGTATAGGIKLIGYVLAAVVGVIFPPLGVMLLLGWLKKALRNHAKQR